MVRVLATAVGLLGMASAVWAQDVRRPGETTVGVSPARGGASTRPTVEVTVRDPGVLLGLAREYAAWGAARQKERGSVAAQVTTVLLTDAATIKTVGLPRWKEFAMTLGKTLTDAERTNWATKIKAAYASDEAAGLALAVGEARDLAGTLQHLGQGAEGSRLAWAWFRQHEADKKVSASSLASVAKLGIDARTEKLSDKKATLERLDKQWAADNATTPLGYVECGMISQMWLATTDCAKAQSWAMRGYENTLGSEEGRAKASSDTLTEVSHLLMEAGLTGKGRGYAGFAQVVARLAREGKLTVGWVPFMAYPLGTAEARTTVRAELLDAQGNPRVEVGKIMSCAYRFASAKEFADWRKEIDDQLAANKDGQGDRRALWLLIKADAEVQVPPKPWPMRARGFLDQALAAAESDKARTRVLRELADYFRGQKRLHEAVDMLESMKPQFQGETSLALILFQQELRSQQMAVEATRAVEAQSAAAGRKQGLISHYESSLKAAQANGQTERASALQGEIARLRAELGN